MKTLTKRFLITVILITVFAAAVPAQTNVSGGIYTNATWTLVNSPYIVVDTVVVFPGVTLTIEPGVVVKFDDNMYIEIRQATLIATGTVTDSITFTSNNPVPVPGSWGHHYYGAIYFNGATNMPLYNYWNISYANTAIAIVQYSSYIKNSTFTHNIIAVNTATQTPVDSCVFKYNETGINNLTGNTANVVVNNCIFMHNTVGISYVNKAILNNCILDSNYRAIGGLIGSGGSVTASQFYNCSFSYNHEGFITAGMLGGNVLKHCVLNNNTANAVFLAADSPDSLISCEIKNNGTGITIYKKAFVTQCDIEYDTIGILLYNTATVMFCNKICNNIAYGLKMNTSANYNASGNYWCTSDSTQIAAGIYDGYDNINYGLVTFFPLDSSCYQNTGIAETNTYHVAVFPNPVYNQLTVTINANITATVVLYDITGRIIMQQQFTGNTLLNTATLNKGMYVYKVRNKSGVISKGKVIKD